MSLLLLSSPFRSQRAMPHRLASFCVLLANAVVIDKTKQIILCLHVPLFPVQLRILQIIDLRISLHPQAGSAFDKSMADSLYLRRFSSCKDSTLKVRIIVNNINNTTTSEYLVLLSDLHDVLEVHNISFHTVDTLHRDQDLLPRSICPWHSHHHGLTENLVGKFDIEIVMMVAVANVGFSPIISYPPHLPSLIKVFIH